MRLNKKISTMMVVAALCEISITTGVLAATTSTSAQAAVQAHQSSNHQLNLSYDSVQGKLSGNSVSGAASYTVTVDGQTFSETFTTKNGQFEANVSNDFYYAVKLGKHTIKVSALDQNQHVLATSQLTSDQFNEDRSDTTAPIKSLAYDSVQGKLSGNSVSGATSYTVTVDGQTFSETFTTKDGQFEANVSNDFYYAVKLGKHTIKVSALDQNQHVLATSQLTSDQFNEDHSDTTAPIKSLAYDSVQGKLSGNSVSGATSYTVTVDGQTFSETFTTKDGQFEANVSNDFYYAVKLGKHTIKVSALDQNQHVLATSQLTSDQFNEDHSDTTAPIKSLAYDSVQGKLSGNSVSGAASYTVTVDGQTFSETFTTKDGQFEANVSNDFYYAVKLGKHTIKVSALDQDQQVIAVGTINR